MGSKCSKVRPETSAAADTRTRFDTYPSGPVMEPASLSRFDSDAEAPVIENGPSSMSLDDFILLRQLHKGKFSVLYLARCKFSAKYHAVTTRPSMNCRFPASAPASQTQKGSLVVIKMQPRHRSECQREQNPLSERNILLRLSYPFTVRLLHAFCDDSAAYLVFPYHPCGDLHAIRTAAPGARLPEGIVRYYAACLALGIAYLHRKGVIHRDIKPGNVLVSAAGVPQFIDLGISHAVAHGSDAICRGTSGTAPYLAPEVFLRGHKHSFASDWYSLGALLYELLTGHRCHVPSKDTVQFLRKAAVAEPSSSGTAWVPRDGSEREGMAAPQLLLKKLRETAPKGVRSYAPVDGISDAAKDFVRMLLLPNPKYRLGAGGVHELMKHPWLRGMAWMRIRSAPAAPWIPPGASDEDTAADAAAAQRSNAQLRQAMPRWRVCRSPSFVAAFNHNNIVIPYGSVASYASTSVVSPSERPQPNHDAPALGCFLLCHEQSLCLADSGGWGVKRD